jgi:lipopolysaccharide transport system ATP-binding protein
MGAVQSLCNTSLVLKNGTFDFLGVTHDAIDKYLQNKDNENGTTFCNNKPREDSDILKISILNEKLIETGSFSFKELIIVLFEIKIAAHHSDAIIGFRIKDQIERNVFTSQMKVSDFIVGGGFIKIKAEIPSCFLVPNKYTLVVGFHVVNKELIRLLDNSVSFVIEETGTDFFQYAGNDYGCVFVDCKWDKF